MIKIKESYFKETLDLYVKTNQIHIFNTTNINSPDGEKMYKYIYNKCVQDFGPIAPTDLGAFTKKVQEMFGEYLTKAKRV